MNNEVDAIMGMECLLIKSYWRGGGNVNQDKLSVGIDVSSKNRNEFRRQ